jgi:hypothetical protein
LSVWTDNRVSELETLTPGWKNWEETRHQICSLWHSNILTDVVKKMKYICIVYPILSHLWIYKSNPSGHQRVGSSRWRSHLLHDGWILENHRSLRSHFLQTDHLKNDHPSGIIQEISGNYR